MCFSDTMKHDIDVCFNAGSFMLMAIRACMERFISKSKKIVFLKRTKISAKFHGALTIMSQCRMHGSAPQRSNVADYVTGRGKVFLGKIK